MTGANKNWIYFFGDKDKPAQVTDKALLGGKGASLAEMSKAGLPVPPGFTIATEACRTFFEIGSRWPDGLEQQVKDSLHRLEKITGRQFGKGAKPLLVSVRSGAAASMPGMMDTILNCGVHPGLAAEVGDTPAFWRVFIQFITMFAKTIAELKPEELAKAANVDPHETPSRALADKYLAAYEKAMKRPFPVDPWRALVECIDMVFNSWNNERAITYRKQHDIRGLLGTAVNVQSMFPSEISGIIFTQDPNNLPANQIIVESSYGLGEAVVSGDVTPDRFVVKRNNLSSFETYIGNKCEMVAALGDKGGRDKNIASLTPAQVEEICGVALKIEEYFGSPMDIEWGWADGRFGLLQSRPIRGLEVVKDVEIGRLEEIERLKKIAGDAHHVWVTHNLGETLRAPTPLTWDIVKHFMSGKGGFGLLYKDLGYNPSKVVCEQGFLELICGRIYADPDRVAKLFWEDGVPMTYDLDEILKDKSVLETAPSKFDAERAEPAFFVKFPLVLWNMFKCSRLAAKARKNAKEIFEKQVLPPFLKYVKEKRPQDLTKLSTSEVLAELQSRIHIIMDKFACESLKPGFFGGMALGGVQNTLSQLMGDQEGGTLSRTLTMGLEGDTTIEQNLMLNEVAHGHHTMQEFLDKFGHRTVGEMELSESRWREDPKYLEQNTHGMKSGRRSPEDIHKENVQKRIDAEKKLPEILKEWGGSSLYEDIMKDLKDAQTLLPYREAGKHYLMMGYELIRLTILELSRRWNIGRDVFFLQMKELATFEGNRAALESEIKKRKIRWQSAQRLDMPDLIDSADMSKLGLAIEYEAATELKGDPVAAGVSTGPARIVFDPREAGDLGNDYILVCPSTDPGWTALFVNARGLIVERGGILSHGAIVARDFGIPAVVCPNATGRIKPGQTIRVDGNRGMITILEGSK